jgi:hypothetical protein
LHEIEEAEAIEELEEEIHIPSDDEAQDEELDEDGEQIAHNDDKEELVVLNKCECYYRRSKLEQDRNTGAYSNAPALVQAEPAQAGPRPVGHRRQRTRLVPGLPL